MAGPLTDYLEDGVGGGRFALDLRGRQCSPGWGMRMHGFAGRRRAVVPVQRITQEALACTVCAGRGFRGRADLDGKDAEEQDLDGGARGVPEGAGDAVLVGDVAGLQQRGGPGPLRRSIQGVSGSACRVGTPPQQRQGRMHG